jgi:hypothetical protein
MEDFIVNNDITQHFGGAVYIMWTTYGVQVWFMSTTSDED